MYEGKVVKQHRLAFYLMTGRWPDTIDHINGDRADNRWCNLREVSAQENMRNKKKYRNNSSGYKGVYLRSTGKYQATIKVDGRNKSLGDFACITSAAIARKLGERTHGYHANHGRAQPS